MQIWHKRVFGDKWNTININNMWVAKDSWYREITEYINPKIFDEVSVAIRSHENSEEKVYNKKNHEILGISVLHLSRGFGSTS